MGKTLKNGFDDFMEFFDSLSSERVINDLEELGVIFGDCNETKVYTLESISHNITEFLDLSKDVLLCA